MQPSAADPAPVFAALGDRTRLALIGKLSDGGRHSIARLTADGSITRQGVAKHLRVLEGAGLVASARVGRESLYALRQERIAEARGWLDAIATEWEDALGRLRAFVEE